MGPPFPRRGRALWPLSALVLGGLFYGPLRMRRSGHRRMPARGGVLVVCNHVSIGDPVALVVSAFPRRRLRMMCKSELFANRALGWYLGGLGAFPVVRDSADHSAIRTARRLLEAGEAVGVFPEGRVTRSGLMRPGAPGIGLLALVPGVSVVPAVVWGTQRFRGPVRIRYGPPVDLSGLDGGSRSARRRAAAERIMAALAALVPTVGGPDQASPGTVGGAPLLP